jgi:GH25 family lysozyme M1 (1,4-beta-N-acetylmuramidase)
LRALTIALATLLLTAGPAAAFPNGQAPHSALSPVAQGGCVKAPRAAARAWNNMQLRAGRILPANGCDSAYRTLARQVFWRNFWCARGKCGNAAVPGTSNHGSDLLGAIDTSPTTVVPTINAIGGRFGWCKRPQTVNGVSCFSDASHEPWHVRYTPAIFTRKRNPCVVREGDRDACVRGLKRRLRAHGCSRVNATSETYGARARACLIRFQTRSRLAGDGVPGPATWRQLYRTPPPEKPPAPQPSVPVPGPIPEPPPKPVASAPAKGVDVSVHQGDIQWDDVRRAGYTFAIAKASEGQDFRDRTFTPARVWAVKQAGMRFGAYHFLRPRAGRSGAIEAQWFVQQARSAGVDWRKGKDLRPVADIESTTLSGQGTCNYLKQFVDEIRRLTGRRTLIYTFPAFANQHLRCGWIDRSHRLWIAHFGVTRPVIPSPWTAIGYSIWQHSSTGRVSGIAGDVDLNITTTAALRALAAR